MIKQALIKNPGENPKVVDLDCTDSLKALQEIVGGWIEAIPLYFIEGGEELSCYCNEEGKLEGLPWNFRLPHNDVVAGPVVFLGHDPETGDDHGIVRAQIATICEKLGWDWSNLVEDAD